MDLTEISIPGFVIKNNVMKTDSILGYLLCLLLVNEKVNESKMF